jgi:hypothetical protein
MDHLVNDYILQQVARFLHEFSVQPNGACLRVAASPLGCHPLQEVAVDLYAEAPFPFVDDGRDCAMK